MSKYGYTGAVPTQANGSNSGVFSITEINKLISTGQWSTLIDLGNVNLIFSYDISGSESYIDFLNTDIQATTYPRQFLVFNYVGTSIGTAYIDFSTNNCSSFTSNTYSYQYTRGTSASTSVAGGTSASATYMDNITYANTGEVAGICELSNMYATETTHVNVVSTINNYDSNYQSIIYGGEVNSSDSEQYNSFRFGLTSGTFSSGNLSVYSYVES